MERLRLGVKASAYNPDARFDVIVSDVELRRNAAGRMLMARIYQPKGKGPFPAVLDLHGGAWTRKDRLAEEPMDRALASSGLLVVAVDLTLATEAPYPACVQDANHAVRWLKANAARWNGDVSKLGVYGSSSGGHVAELLAMRPRDPRYSAIPLEGAPDVDATVSWVAMRSPPSNTIARFENEERRKNETMIQSNKTFFSPWESDPRRQPAGDPRPQRKGRAGAVLHHAGRPRRQRPAGDAGKVRRSLQGGGWPVRLPAVRGLDPRMGRRPGPQTDKARGNRQGIHRAAAKD